MPENDFNKELNEIGVLIQKGGNKAVHTVIAKLSTTQNPMLEQAIESMIMQAAKNPNSPYAMLLDKDGSINYNATTKISQINNPADFIKNLDELEEKGIPFSEADVEAVINDTIEAEIAELEEIANDNSEMTEEEIEAKQIEVERRASMIEGTLSGIAKVGKAAIVVKALSSVRSKVSSAIGGLFSKLFKKKDAAKAKVEKQKDDKNGIFGNASDNENIALGKNEQEKSFGNDVSKSGAEKRPEEKVIGENTTRENVAETPKKPRDKMTLDEKLAEEAKDNPWIIPELRKGVKMKDGVEVKYNPVELKMDPKLGQVSDDLPGDIDDGPGSSDTENDFEDDLR